MTASSMFFPPDWTTWERTDGVSSQPNSPLTSHTFMVSNSSPASPQGLYREPNVVFLDFSQTFIYVGCLVICLSSHMKGYFRNRNAFKIQSDNLPKNVVRNVCVDEVFLLERFDRNI